ncbi:MAG: prepilin peptidase [Patescibacteria group bacterium]
MTFLIFIFGLLIGSFLNVVIFRLPSKPSPHVGEGRERGNSIWRGRSYCPKCRKTLAWYELVPILSFFLQSARCRGCKQKIDWQYPLVELATALGFLLVWTMAGDQGLWRGIEGWVFTSFLIVLFVYDLRYGLIPDQVIFPAMAVAGVFFLAAHFTLLFTAYWLLAILVGGGFFALQYYSSRGRWVGDGDIRFGALMGAMLGWPGVLVALLVSYLIGGAVGAGLLLAGKKHFGQTLPMGTFLALGTFIAMLWGKQIIQWYWPL